MEKTTKRGFCKEDEIQFSGKQLEKLYHAAADFYYLINRGYQVKGASTFVGNHFMLSERQRLALARAISKKEEIDLRKSKEIKILDNIRLDNTKINNIKSDNIKLNNIQSNEKIELDTVNIDGFNTIITLEVALSNSLLLKCMDGTIRDLAGLRGTYHIIDKTELAINLILMQLENWNVKKAVFYLDAPVSNSGRLKCFIAERAEFFQLEIEIYVINEVDSVLESLANVITSDAIILNKCKSYLNLNRIIIQNCKIDCQQIDFENKEIFSYFL